MAVHRKSTDQIYMITCEHAGNRVPAQYRYLFKGKEDVLYSHKAIDFGALELAQYLEERSGMPLYYTNMSRLLIESNRSIDSDELFSEYTRDLGEDEKNTILEAYYYPHRKQVQHEIYNIVEAGNAVVQLAIHTFTPVLDGEVREADVGILFDPQRPLEQIFAEVFKKELLARNQLLKVLFNSPYPGTDDGFPTYLRKCFPKQLYGGVELEVNQKFFLTSEAAQWKLLIKEITDAFLATTKK